MRTNIVIDDALMENALRISGARSKREAVELGLKLLIRISSQEQLRALRGQLPWAGDLDASREGR